MKNIRIASYPATGFDNPYHNLFYGALERYGIEHDTTYRYSNKWLEENKDKIDFLHFHWVSYLYNNSSLKITIKEALKFILYLIKVRRSNIRIIWTNHNLFPHQSKSRIVDYIVRIFLIHLSDLIIAHTSESKKLLAKFFFRWRQVIIIQHGNYQKWYKNSTSREDARQQIKLPLDGFVYLLFGTLKPYKGIEQLIAAFSEIGDSKSYLLIAGRPYNTHYANKLKQLAEGNLNVKFEFGFIEDDIVHIYFNSADIFVLPSQNILTSGSLLLAISFGLPVLIPNKASLCEYINSSCSYVMRNDETLVESLRNASSQIHAGRMGSREEVKNWAKGFDWDSLVKPLVYEIRRLARA